MGIEFILVLAIAIPIILFPAAFVWYMNLGGIVQAVREAREAGTAREKKAQAVTVDTE